MSVRAFRICNHIENRLKTRRIVAHFEIQDFDFLAESYVRALEQPFFEAEEPGGGEGT